MKKITLYFSTVLSTQILAFFTLPLIAKNMSVDDFGHYSLVLSIAGLLGGLTTAWIRNVGFRTFYDAKRSGETWNFLTRYLSLQFVTLLLASLIGLAGARLLGVQQIGWTTALLTFTFVACGDAYALMLNTTRAQELASKYSVVENVMAVLRLLAVLALITTHRLTTPSVLLTYAAILIVGCLILSYALKPTLVRTNNPSTLSIRAILTLGVPAIPLSVAGWVIASSDRIVVAKFLGPTPLGVYSANYAAADKIIGGLAAASFMYLWPRLLTIHNQGSKDMEGSFKGASEVYGTLSIGPTVAIMCFSSTIIRLFADERYVSSAPIMPLIAASSFVSGLVTIVSRPVEIRKSYRQMSAISALAAVVNLVLTLALVPAFGIFGAALGTFLAYATSVGSYLLLDRQRRHRTAWRFLGATTAGSFLAALLISRASDGIIGLTTFMIGYAVYAVFQILRSDFVR